MGRVLRYYILLEVTPVYASVFFTILYKSKISSSVE
jgi:hypothetical protein